MTHDDGENIIEFMGDATGKLSNGLHFFRFQQSVLRSAQFGKILHRAPHPNNATFVIALDFTFFTNEFFQSIGQCDAVFNDAFGFLHHGIGQCSFHQITVVSMNDIQEGVEGACAG